MKNSRKIKKFLVSVLTVTLSIIMFVTQTSAANIITINSEFTDERQIFQATEWITWDKNRNWLLVGVDLSIDENDYCLVGARLDLTITNNTFPSAEPYFDQYQFGVYDYSDTCDSDELLFSITNFNPGFECHTIIATITYDIYYDDCNVVYIFENKYEINLYEEIEHTRTELSNNDD